MKSKTIGIDIRDLRIAKTGAKTYLEELVHAFKEYSNKQYKFIFLDTYLPVYTGKSRFFKLIEHFQFCFWKQFTLPLKAWFTGCDVVICTDFFAPYFSLNFKTIVVFHDAFFLEYPKHYNRYWLYLFKKVGIAAALKANSVITPTLYTQTQISKLSTIPIDKLRVIYEAPKSLIKSVNQNINDLNAHLVNGEYLLHVGTMEKRKNLSRLIAAFGLLNTQYPFLKLVLAGQFSPKSDMDDQQEIQSKIEELGLLEQVIFTGYLSNKDLSSYYSNALIYVFPSINEGFGLPILEAFAHQVPVIASNNTCLPEIGAEAALYFNPFDVNDIKLQIEKLLLDSALREQLIQKGNLRLKQFSWQKTAKDFISLIDDIL